MKKIYEGLSRVLYFATGILGFGLYIMSLKEAFSDYGIWYGVFMVTAVGLAQICHFVCQWINHPLGVHCAYCFWCIILVISIALSAIFVFLKECDNRGKDIIYQICGLGLAGLIIFGGISFASARSAKKSARKTARIEAYEKASSVFGVQLGTTIDYRFTKKDAVDGIDVYGFNPEKRFQDFSQYFVMVTPSSRRVFGVKAEAYFPTERAAEDATHRAAEALSKKYGIEIDDFKDGCALIAEGAGESEKRAFILSRFRKDSYWILNLVVLDGVTAEASKSDLESAVKSHNDSLGLDAL